MTWSLLLCADIAPASSVIAYGKVHERGGEGVFLGWTAMYHEMRNNKSAVLLGHEVDIAWTGHLRQRHWMSHLA